MKRKAQGGYYSGSLCYEGRGGENLGSCQGWTMVPPCSEHGQGIAGVWGGEEKKFPLLSEKTAMLRSHFSVSKHNLQGMLQMN